MLCVTFPICAEPLVVQAELSVIAKDDRCLSSITLIHIVRALVLLTLHIDPHSARDDGMTGFGTAHLAFVGGVIFQAHVFDLEMVLPFKGVRKIQSSFFCFFLPLQKFHKIQYMLSLSLSHYTTELLKSSV